MTDTPTIELGPAFAARLRTREPMQFQHRLAADPRLDLEAVAQLADELGERSVVRDTAERPLVYADGAPEPERVRGAGELIRSLRENRSWLTLLNIEQHPRYRVLIDEQLDRLAGQCGLRPGRLRRRMGFIFASSPQSITGAHFDVEHSLLLQLRGSRVLGFGDFADDGAREHEIRRYWNGSYGKLSSLPVPSHEVPIGPGDGVYIPPFRPHWIHNGPAPSLSLTITFFTRHNEDETLVQAFNERLRRHGMSPRPAGSSALRDRPKAALMRAARMGRRP